MEMNRFSLCLALLCTVSWFIVAQNQPKLPSRSVAAKAAPGFTGDVVVDNGKVRVLRPASANEGDSLRARAPLDTVIVPLSKLALKTGSEPTEALTAGEARFLAAKSPVELSVPAGEPQPLIVELKGDWSARLEVCAEPKTCVRPIRMSGEEVGQSRLLFKNGFLTATLYTLVRGASLTSSYYAVRGTDHILFIPITDLHVNFSGTDEDLKKGQAYFSTGTEVEVSSPQPQPISWMVLRIHIPG